MTNLINRNVWGDADQIFYPQDETCGGFYNATNCNKFIRKKRREACEKANEKERLHDLEMAKLKNEPELGFNQAVSQLSTGPSAMVAEGESDNTALIVGSFLLVLLMAGVGFWYYKKSSAVPALVKA